MIDIVFFIWIGLKMDMPPMWFILCGIYIICGLIKIISDMAKK